MFQDPRDPETKTLLSRNPPETLAMHSTDIERRAEDDPRPPPLFKGR
jgi:hypothetical protein